MFCHSLQHPLYQLNFTELNKANSLVKLDVYDDVLEESTRVLTIDIREYIDCSLARPACLVLVE
jgi:hypothetical protein